MKYVSTTDPIKERLFQAYGILKIFLVPSYYRSLQKLHKQFILENTNEGSVECGRSRMFSLEGGQIKHRLLMI